MAELSIKGLSKSFGEVGVIHNKNLTINDGEFVVFVGPSGCGKSTLLRMVAGLEEATSGLIEIEGKDVTKLDPADRSVAMVFQSYALYPHMNVYDNMAFGLRMMGTPKQEIDALVTKAAGILQLETLLKRKPRQLSGGQRQRVAIGRAIVREPKIFLFDEPLSNLDAELRVDMRLELAKLHQDLKATMIYVTHDQVEAMTLADKIVVLRAGRVEQIGAPLELYHNPCNMFVAGFIGAPRMNFIKANLTKIKDNSFKVYCSDYPTLTYEIKLDDKNIPSNQEVMLGIRPEDFSQEGAIKIDIICDTIEHLGHASFAYTKVNSSSALTIKFNPELSVKIKGSLSSYIDKHKIYLFDPLTGLRIREST